MSYLVQRVSIFLILCLALLSPSAFAAPANHIHFAEVSWTGVSVKTQIAKNILTSLGYDVEVSDLSVPIVFQALNTGDADIFLGNWMPSMKTIATRFFDKGTVVKYCANMEGAKYTLAAPAYVVDGGLHDFSDLAKYADKLDRKIYGIESGNDGNQIIQGMIDANAFGLGDFKLVASSEPLMLTEVQNAIRDKKWIVFLGWSPHYMNQIIDMKYLTGSTGKTFGENDGTATVYTDVRKGFVTDHPNVAHLLKNLTFPVGMMNEISQMLHDNKEFTFETAGLQWLQHHPDICKSWLSNVTTVSGQPALPVFEKYLSTI